METFSGRAKDRAHGYGTGSLVFLAITLRYSSLAAWLACVMWLLVRLIVQSSYGVRFQTEDTSDFRNCKFLFDFLGRGWLCKNEKIVIVASTVNISKPKV